MAALVALQMGKEQCPVPAGCSGAGQDEGSFCTSTPAVPKGAR